MLPDSAKLISVDDHVIEHPNVWQDRLPDRFKEAGPRVIEQTEGQFAGHEVWLYEGNSFITNGVSATAGREEQHLNLDPVRFENMNPGCYDPAARIKDMDADGVHAQVCFSTFSRYAGTRFLFGEDKELSLLCVKAYNDFIIDEWCAFAPGRLVPLVVLPLWDIELCVAEIARTAAKGARAIGFPENPSSPALGLPSWHSRHWDPVLAAAQEARMPLCPHVGTSGATPVTGPDMPPAVTMAMVASNSMGAMLDLMYSGTFVRFPDLKVVLSEGGVGWMPYTMERADRMWERHKGYQPEIDFGVRPSEMVAGHLYGCFIDDYVGIELRERVGVSQIMWESDYPHSDTSWPNSRQELAAMLVDVPDEDALRMAELNAREVFRIED
ncbi:amidohydrolase family protein [Nocardia jinanensis]|uniref:Amidohydrolase n=1 Tax=Nocardia jinanensis TaxID=382504 RepID=A0A917RNC0_9NOCA|nr:amidohydrolase family protein [Nocardia jinanensis]GGL15132.1 amidohydrolase [Nocardia jinanensis]